MFVDAMQDLKQLSLPELLENLVNQTLLHKQITKGGTAKEFGASKEILRALFIEIGLRKDEKQQDEELLKIGCSENKS